MRALGVLVALGAIALWDSFRHGSNAARWHEYAFWIGCGCVGGLFGAINDAVTSTVSKAYFVLGKGLDDDPEHFLAAVTVLGARAGSFAGVVIGGALLLANNPGRIGPRLRYRELISGLPSVLVTAVVVGVAFGAFSTWDVQGLTPVLRENLSESEVQRFLAVQRVHVGLYLGAILATVASVTKIRRARRAHTEQVSPCDRSGTVVRARISETAR